MPTSASLCTMRIRCLRTVYATKFWFAAISRPEWPGLSVYT